MDTHLNQEQVNESADGCDSRAGLRLKAAERIPVRVYCRSAEANQAVAREIADLIRQRQAEGRNCVLGLATGSTPVGVYDELVRMHREEGLSLANVVTFNLDEYYPMQPHELQSYVRFMREHLFDLVDIAPENWHMPDGTIAIEQVNDHCRWYEEQIAKAGGIDVQLLGIGRTGHIGFNEPGSGKAEPHPADHARQGDADRRGERLLRPGERAATRDHDGRRHNSRSAEGDHARVRRAQGEHPRGSRREASEPVDCGQLPAATSQRGGRARRSRPPTDSPATARPGCWGRSNGTIRGSARR